MLSVSLEGLSSPPGPLALRERGNEVRVRESRSEQSLEIAPCDVSIRDSEHLKARGRENGRAGRVVFSAWLVRVDVAVDFQHDTSFERAEVHNEAVQYMLAAELDAEHAAIAQQRPGEALSRCSTRAQFAGESEFLSARGSPKGIHERNMTSMIGRHPSKYRGMNRRNSGTNPSVSFS